MKHAMTTQPTFQPQRDTDQPFPSTAVINRFKSSGQYTSHHNARLKSTLSSAPMSVAARSKAQDCGRSLAGFAGSNLDGGVGVCFLC
jgi:hypothetical protein